MGSLKNLRHERILEMLDESGSITIAEAAEALDVSAMTVRRDLDELATAGLLRRQRGGAVQNLGRGYEPPLRSRVQKGSAAKDVIGRCAAAMAAPGDAIGFDVGSTTLAVARHLHTPNITIVTASVRVAIEVAANFALEHDLRVILLGGILRGEELSLVGSIADRTLDNLRLDRSFIGVSGFTMEDGPTEFNMDDLAVKQRMIDVSAEVIVVTDGAKFGKTAFAKICEIPTISRLVTDSSAPPEYVNGLRELGVDVVIADQ